MFDNPDVTQQMLDGTIKAVPDYSRIDAIAWFSTYVIYNKEAQFRIDWASTASSERSGDKTVKNDAKTVIMGSHTKSEIADDPATPAHWKALKDQYGANNPVWTVDPTSKR
jgi:hypothetical protein